MLINTKVIKQAFGVSDTNEFTVESINIIEALESMFKILNKDLGFWSFALTTDTDMTHRVKIIDESTSAFDFDDVDIDEGIKSKRSVTNADGKLVKHEGIFFFPTWRHDSFVKRQNLTAKIPNALQLTTMYGSNLDTTSEISNPGNYASEKSGVLAGGLFNDFPDEDKKGINIKNRNDFATNVFNIASSQTADSSVYVKAFV